MSDPVVPPPQYVAYPRTSLYVGSAARLQMLAEGYAGLSKLLGGYMITVFVIGFVSLEARLNLRILEIPVVIVAIAFTGRYVGMVGDGKGWSKSKKEVARGLMAANYFVCGLIGFIVFQKIVSTELKKYNVRLGFLSVNQADFDNAMAKLQTSGPMSMPPG